jgi:hypothetical protein
VRRNVGADKFGWGLGDWTADMHPLLDLPALTLATAVLISAALTAGTKSLRVKPQPSASLASSQVLPAPVGSPICSIVV